MSFLAKSDPLNFVQTPFQPVEHRASIVVHRRRVWPWLLGFGILLVIILLGVLIPAMLISFHIVNDDYEGKTPKKRQNQSRFLRIELH